MARRQSAPVAFYMRRTKIFTGLKCWPTEKERWLVGFVRATIDPASYEERFQKYAARAEAFEAVSSDGDADVVALPFVWDYYLKQKQTGTAQALARLAQAAGKRIIVWNGGDLEALVPIPNAIQFNHGPFRSLSRIPKKVFAFPQFKSDWLETYCGGELRPRTWCLRPSVGFCGWASGNRAKLAIRKCLTAFHLARYHLGCSNYVPPPLRSPLLLRQGILNLLRQEVRIRTNFMNRNQYRGGLRAGSTDETFSPTRLEFVNNILENDYTVCVRGVGNFSARFYETLCLGRIPIFVNTDCILPYDFTVNWRDYCVWVEAADVHRLPEILLEFHQGLSPDSFLDLQKDCRRIWLDRLSSNGFYTHFHEHLAGRED